MLGSNSWIEVDAGALEHNLGVFRTRIGPRRRLAAVVKANAYGHGMVEVSSIAVKAGADWLAVHCLEEGLALRQVGHTCPILLLGPVHHKALEEAVEADLRLTVYDPAMLRHLSKAACRLGRTARVHFKLETGTHRQGIPSEQLDRMAEMALRLPGIELEGASTHFANIEDTTDHSYAKGQLLEFEAASGRLRRKVASGLLTHCACSAAAILMPQTHMEMIRLGISLYGYWPSKETLISARELLAEPMELRRCLSWKARLAQIKEVEANRLIGYGCSYKTTRRTILGVLPVGYSDGYARGLSNRAHVLVRGCRARVLGRICMNLMMVDLTDVGPVTLEDEVVLIGKQGREEITAEDLAQLLGTIHYEIMARMDRGISRVLVRRGGLEAAD